MFPCFNSRQISGCCRLINSPEDIFLNYENDFKTTTEMALKEKNNEEFIGIDIFGETERGGKDFFSTKFSKFGKIAVAANGSFYGIQNVKNEIFLKGKVLFTESLSELILHLIVKEQNLVVGIKKVSDYLKGKYNFAVLGKWGIFVYCIAGLMVATRRDGGVVAGTNFERLPDCDAIDVIKKDNILLHLQNGSLRAVP